MSLLTCSECHRHVRRHESTCPFCGADISDLALRVPERSLPSARLSRTALLAFAAATVGAGCGGKTGEGTGSGDTGGAPNSAGGMSGGASGTAAIGSGGVIGAGGRTGSGGVIGAGGRTGSGGVGVGSGGLGTGGYVVLPPYGVPPGGYGNVPVNTGGSGGTLGRSGGAAGISGAAGAADGPRPGCVGPDGRIAAHCCADTPPDCTEKPDGYPGYGCTPWGQPLCLCNCAMGKWWCGC